MPIVDQISLSFAKSIESDVLSLLIFINSNAQHRLCVYFFSFSSTWKKILFDQQISLILLLIIKRDDNAAGAFSIVRRIQNSLKISPYSTVKDSRERM